MNLSYSTEVGGYEQKGTKQGREEQGEGEALTEGARGPGRDTGTAGDTSVSSSVSLRAGLTPDTQAVVFH